MNNSSRQVFKMLTLISQIGITVLTTIFMCMAFGYIFEKIFGINIMIWCIVLGVLSSFKSAYIVIKKYIGGSDGKG